MELNNNQKQLLIYAKSKVRKLQVFYLHLVLYTIILGLLLYNLYVIEEGEYKIAIIWLNLSTIATWSIFIAIHAWSVFKGRLLFKKSWEDRKIKEFIKVEATEKKLWE
ncbi:2TM domain-containing protein [Winogradskyella luteola]|uniref:2TM domain-containing protein n=1 Tax=Winogradskyella luteola TaxID=2828330 RepID=A0A9X1F696_9FLAO|nr:2TM domain-containing protein [Winogradskyella luteola]MBV7267889.1 2TM domain-containing protein [Winogradskyella luteola]